MRRFHLSMSLLVLAVIFGICAWAQRGGGSPPSAPRSTGATHSAVVDPGAAYGVTGPGMLSSGKDASSTHRADQEPKVEFSSTTILVQVPTVVTDKSGAHVHNLRKEDFQIFENGKEQRVSTFEEITAVSSPLPPPATEPGEYSNLTVDPRQARTLCVIVIDSINTPYLDQAYGRQQLIKYLSENLEPGQPLALVLLGNRGVRVLQPLTADPAQLIAAVKKVRGEIPAMQAYDTQSKVAALDRDTINNTPANNMPGALAQAGAFSDAGGVTDNLELFELQGDAVEAAYDQKRAIETTLRAFLNIATYVSGIPGRKALIWATGSFPFTIDSPSTVPGGQLSLLYERAMAALNQTETSVYPLDIRGLVGNYLSDANFKAGTGPQAMKAAIGRSWLQTSTLDTLKDFADMTGGRAFYNTNDLAGSFHKAMDDASSYYLLGYYLDTHNDKPGWRSLKVKVNKPGVELRARSGFFVTNATMNRSVTQALDEEIALNSPFDATSVPIRLRWLGTTLDGDKRKVNFKIAVPSGGVLIDEAAQNRFSLDLNVVVTDAKGTTAGKFEQPLQGNIKPESMATVKAQGISYHNLFEVSPGQYMVRMIVRDNLTGNIGSVSAPLTVN